MAPTPSWVKDLKPAGPQGTELLSQERAKSNVNVKALSTFLHTQEGIDRKRTILKILQQEKVFDKSQNYFAGRIDRFETALARAKRLRQLQVKHSWTDTDKQVANELISEPGPYGLHESMFLVCLCVEIKRLQAAC
jgi:acyl-CoA oxidase